MENNMRFRNHSSIILENSIKTIGTIVAIFFLNFISEIGGNGIQLLDVLWLIGFLVIATGIIIGIHAIIWSRTYIIIEENTLVVERNTINKKRNTISLHTISNVNLEQNILEMILGTCKVKLDTNSLSTADQTDVNIVLKKDEAERFRRIILAKDEDFSQTQTEGYSDTDAEDNVIGGDLGDIILHGLFSIRISALIFLVVILVAEIYLLQSLGMDNIEESLSELLGGLITGAWFTVGIGWSILKEFFKYLNFRTERKGDKIFLNYGLFKKIAYSVPVNKINGIRLTQTPIARMGKRYMVEIINVGMDDNENEANTFFLPYSKVEKLKKQLHTLIPEFDGALEIKEERQSKAIWLLSIPWVLLYIILCVVAYMLIGRYVQDEDLANIFGVAVLGLLVVGMLIKLVGFFTKGIKVDEKYLKIVNGYFAKRILFVKYDKIQYITGNQCIIAKHFKIQKGHISLLASMKNRVHILPYFKEEDMELLKKYFLS